MRTGLHVDDLRLEEGARLGCLSSPAFDDVREHVATCDVCRVRLSEIYEFLAFAEEADNGTETTLVQRHDTLRGTVFLVVTGSDATEWEARAIGAGYYSLRTFTRGPDALAWLEQWLTRKFPNRPGERDANAEWTAPIERPRCDL